MPRVVAKPEPEPEPMDMHEMAAEPEMVGGQEKEADK
jgi:hypothetical protein